MHASDVEIAARQAKEKANAAAAAAQLLEKEHLVALERACLAEEEAAAVVQEHDTAAARASDAMARAAKERAAAVVTAPGDVSSSSSTTPPDFASAMLLNKALSLLNLHAQAIAINNIWTLVPIILDVDFGNYGCWRDRQIFAPGSCLPRPSGPRLPQLVSDGLRGQVLDRRDSYRRSRRDHLYLGLHCPGRLAHC